jgi:hypothetical protein
MSQYGEEKERHRHLRVGMSGKQADEQIIMERERRSQEAMLKTMREGAKTHTNRKPDDRTKTPSQGKSGNTSSNGGELFVGALIVAFLVGAFNSSSDDKTAAPVPVTPPEAKEVVLKIASPLSGSFVCTSENGKYVTTFTATAANKMAVSRTDPSLKGKPSIEMETIDKFSVSCKHSEMLINDYYRAFGPK